MPDALLAAAVAILGLRDGLRICLLAYTEARLAVRRLFKQSLKKHTALLQSKVTSSNTIIGRRYCASTRAECWCRTVDDVDLFPAALAEQRVEGGLVGPTFACLLARQFADVRSGDRYWYENSGPFRFSQGTFQLPPDNVTTSNCSLRHRKRLIDVRVLACSGSNRLEENPVLLPWMR